MSSGFSCPAWIKDVASPMAPWLRHHPGPISEGFARLIADIRALLADEPLLEAVIFDSTGLFQGFARQGRVWSTVGLAMHEVKNAALSQSIIDSGYVVEDEVRALFMGVSAGRQWRLEVSRFAAFVAWDEAPHGTLAVSRDPEEGDAALGIHFHSVMLHDYRDVLALGSPERGRVFPVEDIDTQWMRTTQAMASKLDTLFRSGSSHELSDFVMGLPDIHEGVLWQGRAHPLVSAVMSALTWLRDAGRLELGMDVLRESLSLARIVSLAKGLDHPDMPRSVRLPLRGYLLSLPGYRDGQALAKMTGDRHGQIERVFEKAFRRIVGAPQSPVAHDNPFAFESSYELTQRIADLVDAPWRDDARAMLSPLLRALTWLRDIGCLDLDAQTVRPFLSFERIGTLTDVRQYPDIPWHIRDAVQACLSSFDISVYDDHARLENACIKAVAILGGDSGKDGSWWPELPDDDGFVEDWLAEVTIEMAPSEEVIVPEVDYLGAAAASAAK